MVKYLVHDQYELEEIQELVVDFSPEFLEDVNFIRLLSKNELHFTMLTYNANQKKELIITPELGSVINVESIPMGDKKLAMTITLRRPNGAKLILLYESLEILMRLKWEI